MTAPPDADAFVMATLIAAVAIAVLFLALVAGCVTRTTVCVEAAHALDRRTEPYGAPRDTTGASVCTEFERP